jgi:hypothetical protein
MAGITRITVLTATVICVVTLAACTAQTPPSPSPPASSSTASRLAAYATWFGATQAWWTVMPHAQAVDLTLGRTGVIAPDTSPSTPTYVVLMRGEFSDAGGRPAAWALGVPQGTAVTSAERPRVPGATWSPLPLASP